MNVMAMMMGKDLNARELLLWNSLDNGPVATAALKMIGPKNAVLQWGSKYWTPEFRTNICFIWYWNG